MAMTRRGGSGERFAFFGRAGSSPTTAGGSFRPAARSATLIFAINCSAISSRRPAPICASAGNRPRRARGWVPSNCMERSCDRSQWGCAREARENRGNIQNEDDRAVAEDGGAADQIARDDFARERLDDQFLFAD